jgi:3-oxoadipate enol-lactonase
MPYATTPDNVKLYYEEVGQGTPILFVHEFAGDHRSWERQLREFGKRYRCIAYSARGYRPSDIPADPKAYSYMHVMRDAVAMLDHLKIDKAHLIGLSMGGYTALQVALNHPQRVRSLVLAGAGSGSERWYTKDFHKRSHDLPAQFEREGSAAVAQTYGRGPSRFNWNSRIRAALPNFRGSFPSTTRKDQRICRADSRASDLRSMTSNVTFGGLRCRL